MDSHCRVKLSDMTKPRDHKAEYARRLARAFARGLSRPQARGHARAGEAPFRPKPATGGEIAADLQEALKSLRQTGTITQAAKAAQVSPERLRRFLRENELIKKEGRRWRVTDKLIWDVEVTSRGSTYPIRINRFDQASLNGRHQAAIGAFLRSNVAELLAPFAGQAVIDAKGKAHPLETDPSALYRLAAAGNEVFHNVYRLSL